MKLDNKKIIEKIERLRKKMYDIYEKNPNDHQLLKVSQELDSLLNELDRLQIKNKRIGE